MKVNRWTNSVLATTVLVSGCGRMPCTQPKMSFQDVNAGDAIRQRGWIDTPPRPSCPPDIRRPKQWIIAPDIEDINANAPRRNADFWSKQMELGMLR